MSPLFAAITAITAYLEDAQPALFAKYLQNLTLGFEVVETVHATAVKRYVPGLSKEYVIPADIVLPTTDKVELGL